MQFSHDGGTAAFEIEFSPALVSRRINPGVDLTLTLDGSWDFATLDNAEAELGLSNIADHSNIHYFAIWRVSPRIAEALNLSQQQALGITRHSLQTVIGCG